MNIDSEPFDLEKFKSGWVATDLSGNRYYADSISGNLIVVVNYDTRSVSYRSLYGESVIEDPHGLGHVKPSHYLLWVHPF